MENEIGNLWLFIYFAIMHANGYDVCRLYARSRITSDVDNT